MKYFEVVSGFATPVSDRQYGKQDVGISPAGPADLGSYELGTSLMTGMPSFECVETFTTVGLKFSENCVVAITGAPVTSHKMNLAFVVTKGETINVGGRTKGTYTYIFIAKGNAAICSEATPDYSWVDAEGRIRVCPGPEYSWIENPEAIESNYWVTADMSKMGVRFDARGNALKLATTKNMVSGPVSDGTIQITPNGPIALMRHRQTVGGYPRGYYIIDADLDIMAQYSPNQIVRFKLVTEEEANSIYEAKMRNLA